MSDAQDATRRTPTEDGGSAHALPAPQAASYKASWGSLDFPYEPGDDPAAKRVRAFQIHFFQLSSPPTSSSSVRFSCTLSVHSRRHPGGSTCPATFLVNFSGQLVWSRQRLQDTMERLLVLAGRSPSDAVLPQSPSARASGARCEDADGKPRIIIIRE